MRPIPTAVTQSLSPRIQVKTYPISSILADIPVLDAVKFRGTKVSGTVNCHYCQAQNSGDAIFCESCGSRLEVACPHFATANRVGARFCRKCGQQLLETAPVSLAIEGKFASVETYTPSSFAGRRRGVRDAAHFASWCILRGSCNGLGTTRFRHHFGRSTPLRTEGQGKKPRRLKF
jgi:ribosomal protein L40E